MSGKTMHEIKTVTLALPAEEYERAEALGLIEGDAPDETTVVCRVYSDTNPQAGDDLYDHIVIEQFVKDGRTRWLLTIENCEYVAETPQELEPILADWMKIEGRELPRGMATEIAPKASR